VAIQKLARRSVRRRGLTEHFTLCRRWRCSIQSARQKP
jgi:hypothetical protein